VQDGFAELDKLGWIREVAGADRNKQLAAAYLVTIAEKKEEWRKKIGVGGFADARRVGADYGEHREILQRTKEAG